MDIAASVPKIIKRRRRYSAGFKHRVLAECQQSNTSVVESRCAMASTSTWDKWCQLMAVNDPGAFVRAYLHGVLAPLPSAQKADIDDLLLQNWAPGINV